MFIGHFAVAFAAKRATPRTSLGTLTAAAQLLDLIWPFLVLAGIEHVRVAPGSTTFTPLDFISYPYSHSAMMAVLWSVVAAVIYWRVTQYARGAAVIGAAVFSHWVLDALTHRPDLPLYPGSDIRVGLGLWNSVPATLIVESGMFAVGVYLYVAGTRRRDRIGSIGLWTYVAVLVALYAANVLGPPPPTERAIAVAALGMFIFVAWAWWVDRHRDWRQAEMSAARGIAG